jgi:DNA polymerase-3 subunit delta'
MPDTFSALEANLAQAIAQNRVAHSYLFLGPEGVGKFQFALKFAQALVCAREKFPPCQECRECRQIQSRTHPDLHILEVLEGEKQIKIDEVREFQKQLSFKPFQARRKVGIIKEAESLTIQAMNSLLKLLEEPLPDTVLILTCGNRSRLLATVVSRCQILRFPPVKKELLVEILLKEQRIPLEKARVVANYAEGSLEKIDELVPLMEQRRKFFENWLVARSENPVQGFEFVQSQSFIKNLPVYLDFFINWHRDLLRIKFNEDPEFNPDFELGLKTEASRLTIAQIISRLDILLKLEEEMISFNLNPSSVGEQIFFEMR